MPLPPQVGWADHLLDVCLRRAFSEQVRTLGREAKTPGVACDLWGYFFTPVKGDPPEKAHFEAILIVPAK